MVDGKELKKKLITIFKKHGLSHGDANISSNAIINAEIVGAHTHGPVSYTHLTLPTINWV